MPRFDIFGHKGGGEFAAIDRMPDGSLKFSKGLPDYTSMSMKGQGWTAQTATLFGSIAAYPTTTARLELFNNNPGWVMVVSDLFAAQILATAVSTAWAIFAMVTTSKAAPTNTALLVCSTSGKDAYTTTAASPLVTAVDTTVVANGWRPFGPGMGWGTAAATPGSSISAPVDGKLLVPPNRSLCIIPVNSVATASAFQCGATFYWESLPITL